MENNVIFICLCFQTALNFNNVIQFANSLKYNYIHLKKIGIKNLLDWVFTLLLFYNLDSKYSSFYIILNNNCKVN